MTNFSIFVSGFSHRGVQNLDLGGANAPPFAMPRSRINQGFSTHTRLTIGRGVQGGASLIGYRGCIVRLYQNWWQDGCLMRENDTKGIAAM